MKKFIQWITVLVCWFTLSPLFYYLAKRWKLLRTWRVVLLLISPLFWYLYSVITIVLVFFADDMRWRCQFTNPYEIAEITRSPFPFYIVVYHDSEPEYIRDRSNEKYFMFLRLPSEAFYHAVDSLTHIEHSEWSKDGNEYTYRNVWNGKDSPTGGDLFLTIHIEKGSRFGLMEFGSW